jgi:hypothetical protein
MDERHGCSLAGCGLTGDRRAKLVDQLADRAFGLLVPGCAAAGRCELAEEPQKQERLVRDPDLADTRLAQASQSR